MQETKQNNEISQEFEVSFEQEGERLDKYLALIYEKQSRSFFQKIIKENLVLVNGKAQKANYRISAEDTVSVTIPKAQ